MPFRFFRGSSSSLTRGQSGKAPPTSEAAGQACEKATSVALQDPPPPYTSENNESDDDKDSLCESTSIKPTITEVPPQSDFKTSSSNFIRICPHATSSFERIQRIVELPEFKESYRGLDALIPGPNHCHPRYTPAFRQCKPESDSKLSITGWGKYLYDRYGTEPPQKIGEQPGAGEGLVVKLSWDINFTNVPSDQRQSRGDIQRTLSIARIEVCTHLMLSDPRIVAAAHAILHPGDNDVDPIDAWEAGCNNGTTTIACEQCATVAEIRGRSTSIQIDTKRYLGRGVNSTDPSWLAQCGVREGATTVVEKPN